MGRILDTTLNLLKTNNKENISPICLQNKGSIWLAHHCDIVAATVFKAKQSNVMLKIIFGISNYRS